MAVDASAPRYEPEDLRPRRFLIGAICFALFLLTIGSIVLLIHNRLYRATESDFVPRSVAEGKLEASDAPPLQPQVGHDVSEADDIAAMRAGESAVFDKLGWSWDGSRQLHAIPPAVVDAVRHRAAATQPTGRSSAARGMR